MAVVGGGCGGAMATSVAVGEAVDVDALQLLTDVGKLGVGAVGRGLGPARKMRIVSSLRRFRLNYIQGDNGGQGHGLG